MAFSEEEKEEVWNDYLSAQCFVRSVAMMILIVAGFALMAIIIFG
jgi:hypothetical protein